MCTVCCVGFQGRRIRMHARTILLRQPGDLSPRCCLRAWPAWTDSQLLVQPGLRRERIRVQRLVAIDSSYQSLKMILKWPTDYTRNFSVLYCNHHGNHSLKGKEGEVIKKLVSSLSSTSYSKRVLNHWTTLKDTWITDVKTQMKFVGELIGGIGAIRLV